MSCRQGMTLMEMIVVLIIVGIVAAFFFPNFFRNSQYPYSQNAKSNLLAIFPAQMHYNNDHGAYCISTTAAQPACAGVSAQCGGTMAALNCNLNLNISDSVYTTYTCINDASGFLCKACTIGSCINTGGNTLWTVTNNPIVLSGNVNPNCTGSYCI
ncbi:MAG: prepilin-type N-terminal cleavage/methylation domain-containing protein [Candidatus Omnitrophica bacterium]|nr:prepilin-type N-terminal cleavage/methylation domain-containing protein [Candidatus Omnitrophota bacterium]